MPIPNALRPLLSELKRRLQALYGDRLDRLVLYGSQARGDTHAESDVDVLVVLHGPVNPGREIRRMSDVCFQLGMEHETLISAHPVSSSEYPNPTSNWLANVRREGVTV